MIGQTPQAHHPEAPSPNSGLQCDGLQNEAGSLTKVVNVILQLDGHTKQTNFTVTNLGKQDLILKFT